MQKIKVLLSTGDKVNRFVAAVSKYRFPIHMSTGRYRVDAKSLIGIFSLNLEKPITMEIADDGEEGGRLIEEMKPFAAE